MTLAAGAGSSGSVTGSTTPSDPPSDFNGDGYSDILWQNTNGQAAIWEMNGTNQIVGSNVGGNPGPSWKAIGTGDFNDDGHSDILCQNTNGQASIWEMNGTNLIGGGARQPESRAELGKRSERATSTTMAIPTSCGRNATAKPRSGK